MSGGAGHRWRVLVIGSNGGSGGYREHLAGILGKGRLPENAEVVLTGGLNGMRSPLDDRVTLLPQTSPPSRPARWWWWIAVFPHLLTSVKPDVVLFPAAPAVPWSPLPTVPFVIVAQNLLPFEPHELTRYRFSAMTAAMLASGLEHARYFRQAAGVIFLSNHSRAAISRLVPGIRRTAVIPHGLGREWLAAEPRAGALRKVVRLAYVSTIFLYKHQWNVVEAVHLLRRKLGLDLRLALIGGGEPIAIAKLKDRIAKLGASSFVSMTGSLPTEAVRAELKTSDVFVFASSCETFGLPLLEAMGMGLPIACAARGTPPEILRDAGVYFDPERPASIANSIEILLTDDDLRTRCATSAHGYARQFTWEASSRNTFAFLRECSRQS